MLNTIKFMRVMQTKINPYKISNGAGGRGCAGAGSAFDICKISDIEVYRVVTCHVLTNENTTFQSEGK